MPGPAAFRDSTEIVVPCGALNGLREDLEAEFTVSVFDVGDRCRIVGSPVEIKGASRFLSRRGVRIL
ncbi:MAG: hypothetical protein ABEJ61_03125 [Haloferacaceae archaeon]